MSPGPVESSVPVLMDGKRESKTRNKRVCAKWGRILITNRPSVIFSTDGIRFRTTNLTARDNQTETDSTEEG